MTEPGLPDADGFIGPECDSARALRHGARVATASAGRSAFGLEPPIDVSLVSYFPCSRQQPRSRPVYRALQRQAWQWTLVNPAQDGALPAGRQ